MTRTIALIVFLLILSSLLVYIAVQPQKNNTPTPPQTTLQTTASPTPIRDTKLSLSPNPISFSSTSASVTVQIETGQNTVSGVQLEIAYDPNSLTNVQITPGSFISNPVVLLDVNDEKSGRISYALAISPTQNGVQGTGTVATISFSKNPKALPNIQETEITLLDKSLVTMLGAQSSVLQTATGATILLNTGTKLNTVTNVPVQPTTQITP